MRLTNHLFSVVVMALAGCGMVEKIQPRHEPATNSQPKVLVQELPPTSSAPSPLHNKWPLDESVALPENKKDTLGATTPDLHQAEPVNPDSSVFFSSRSIQVDDAGKVLLRNHAERLKANPKLIVILVGHADPFGSRSYNLAIAEKRVDSVISTLRSFGVPKAQIRRTNSGRGAGNTTCRTEICRRVMRRVDIVYTDVRQPG